MIWTPFETAWPAGVAFLGWLLALGVLLRGGLLGGGHFARHRTRDILPVLSGFFAAGLFIRLLVIPALSDHVYDGHEAEYWDLFAGTRLPNRGGTVLYPAMQWFWYGLGLLLPAHPAIPVVLMSIVGVAAAGLLGVTVAELAEPRAGWLAAGLALLHPAQAAWSSSAYNVILPHFFGCLCIAAAARLSRSHRPSLSLGFLGALSFTLAVSTRLDAALMGIPAVLLLFLERPIGRSWAASLKSRVPLLLPTSIALLLTARAAWPLVFPGEVPGAGERWLSFCINVRILEYFAPFDGLLGLALVGVGALFALRRWRAATIALGLGALLNHVVLSAFDDYGERHALSALPGIVWCLAVGAFAAPGWWTGWMRAVIPLLSAGLLLLGLRDLRGRYYGSEEDFAVLLAHSPWASLPRQQADEARTHQGQACGWVNEDSRVSEEPFRSHFNLIQSEEAEGLRGPGACLHWCMDVQDWRWSSRAVRDRAIRVSQLYALHPVAVVEQVVGEGGSGYSCLVFDLGERQCCDSTPANSEPAAAGPGAHAGGPFESGLLEDPRIP